jgi:hypothetical protein
MNLPRIMLSLILTLTLSGAPVTQALAAAAPDVTTQHAGHVSHPATDSDSAAGHDHHKNACAQHDSCESSCCKHCNKCSSGLSSSAVQTDVLQSVLTPSVDTLSFSSQSSPRERPPRTCRH